MRAARALVGSTAVALVLATAPVLVGGSAEAAGPLRLTGVEARKAFLGARSTTVRQILKQGAYVEFVDEDVDKSDPYWERYVTKARVDGARRTLRFSQARFGGGPEPAVLRMDACENEPGDHWTVAKDRVGRWESLGGISKVEARALKRLGKPSAQWAKRGGEGTRLKTLVGRLLRAGSPASPWDFFSDVRFDGGTRAATPGGWSYAMSFRDGDGDPGTLTMTTKRSGAITRLQVLTAIDDPEWATKEVTTVRYGKQRVTTPAPSRWVRADALVKACASSR